VVRIDGTGRLRGQSFELSNNLGAINQNLEFGEADKRCLPHFFGGPSRSEPQGRPRSRASGDSLLHFWNSSKFLGISVSLHGPGCFFCFELAVVRQCATADRVSASTTHAYHARSVCGLGKALLDGCLEPAGVNRVIGLNAVRCAVTASSWPLEIVTTPL
jgi:hypothetical protein